MTSLLPGLSHVALNYDAVFCDVFEMSGGKIRSLTSYLMTLNTSIRFES